MEWWYRREPKKQKKERQKESISWIKKLWLNLRFWKKDSELTTTSQEQVSQQNDSLTHKQQSKSHTEEVQKDTQEETSHSCVRIESKTKATPRLKQPHKKEIALTLTHQKKIHTHKSRNRTILSHRTHKEMTHTHRRINLNLSLTHGKNPAQNHRKNLTQIPHNKIK